MKRFLYAVALALLLGLFSVSGFLTAAQASSARTTQVRYYRSYYYGPPYYDYYYYQPGFSIGLPFFYFHAG